MDRDNIASTNNICAALIVCVCSDPRRPYCAFAAASVCFYDKINLNVATYPQLQERLITATGADGRQVLSTQLATAGAAKRRVSDATQR